MEVALELELRTPAPRIVNTGWHNNAHAELTQEWATLHKWTCVTPR